MKIATSAAISTTTISTTSVASTTTDSDTPDWLKAAANSIKYYVDMLKCLHVWSVTAHLTYSVWHLSWKVVSYTVVQDWSFSVLHSFSYTCSQQSGDVQGKQQSGYSFHLGGTLLLSVCLAGLSSPPSVP